ncbi:MAG: hypothetical protein R3C53_09300 [Pirellulaceae bacterium]
MKIFRLVGRRLWGDYGDFLQQGILEHDTTFSGCYPFSQVMLPKKRFVCTEGCTILTGFQENLALAHARLVKLLPSIGVPGLNPVAFNTPRRGSQLDIWMSGLEEKILNNSGWLGRRIHVFYTRRISLIR